MSNHICALMIAISIFSSLGVSQDCVYGEELQITDYLGLIRAQKNIQDKASVRITVLTKSGADIDLRGDKPLLTQRSGFSPDVEAVEVHPREYIFPGIAAGVWRIRLRNNGLLLDQVEILVSKQEAAR